MKSGQGRTVSEKTISKLRRFATLAAMSSLMALHPDNGAAQSQIGDPVPDLSCSISPGANDVVSVAITKLVEFGGTEIDGPDFDPINRGDFYAKVFFNGFELNSFNEAIDGGNAGCRGGFFPPVGCIQPRFDEIIAQYGPNQLWRFNRAVPPTKTPVVIRIEIWDDDDRNNRDDIADVKFGSGEALNLIFDPNTGKVVGDVNSPQSCSSAVNEPRIRGRGSPVEVCFEVSSLPDSDGDGLFDVWETCGFDPDGPSPMAKIDLPAFGAEPMHKDLFLELDWVGGAEPTGTAIQALKSAFAVAPIDAGTRASELENGVSAKLNPDGKPGINLHVDTGDLRDAMGNLVGDNLGGGNAIPLIGDICAPDDGNEFTSAKSQNFDRARGSVFRYAISHGLCTNEDGAGVNTCSDGIDNGNDGLTDASGTNNEDGAGIGTCTDGNDNGSDGLSDEDDPECKADPECLNFSWAELGGNDLLLRGVANFPVVIMHEIGHALNLDHGGDEEHNCKPNYVSVMNYRNAGLAGIGQAKSRNVLLPISSFVQGLVDFSPPRFDIEDGGNLGSCGDGVDNAPDGLIDGEDPDCLARGVAPLPVLNESKLDESTILDLTDPINLFAFTNVRGTQTRWPLNGDRDGDGKPDGADWNDNGRPPLAEDGAGVIMFQGRAISLIPGTCEDGMNNGMMDEIDAQDSDCKHDSLDPINIDFVSVIDDCRRRNRPVDNGLTGFNDWLAISIPFAHFPNASAGVVNPPPLDQEPTIEKLIELERELNTTDLAIDKVSKLDEGRSDLVYVLTVTNKGPNPAGRVQVIDELPLGVSHKSNNAGCMINSASLNILTCNLGALLPNEQRQIEIGVGIAKRDDGSTPRFITNTATVKNVAEFAGPDLEPSDNSASATTTLRKRGLPAVEDRFGTTPSPPRSKM